MPRLALATVNLLRQRGLTISEEHLRLGLAGTTVPARLELVGRRPWLVLDCAHNVASIERLIDWLPTLPAQRRLLLFAISRDKQIAEILRRFVGQVTEICFTRYRSSARVPTRLSCWNSGRRWAARAVG